MNRTLWLILALCALLGLGFAWTAPLGSAPDEGAHLQYVRVLATEGRLPALNITRRRDRDRDPHYEAHQPPLYYALAVPFYHVGRLIGGEPAAGQACRVLSILLGLAGVALVWLLAREVAPDRPALWIAAAGFTAFLPMRLHVIASVSNDALAEATSSLALLVMVRAVLGKWDLRRAALLGGALGLAFLAKQSSIMLFPPALLAIYLATRREVLGDRAAPATDEEEAALQREIGGWFLRTSAAAGGVLLLLTGWWLVRNTLLYGDPIGQGAFDWYFADTPRWVDFRDAGYSFGRYLGELVLPTTFATFWGAFGHLSPEHPELFLGGYGRGYPPPSTVYPWLALATLLSAAGGLVYAWRSRRVEPPTTPGTRPAVWVLGAHAIFVVAAFFRFNATYFQAQGRYLFPAIGALALALSGGWLEWTRWGRPVPGSSRAELAGAWLVVAAMLILAVYALFWVLPALQSL
ncbi:MAG: glycosyltransferase family 39 protein [Armatimonadota bacterium]